MILRAGRFDPENGSSASAFQDFLSQLQASPPSHIVIYFHGGLVNLASGKAAAADLGPRLEAVGATPIFVIWESGWDEVIEQNLPAVFNEAIFKRIQRRVAQFLKGKIDKAQAPSGARSTAALPLTLEEEIKAELAKGEAGAPMFGDVPRDIPELSKAEQRTIENEIKKDSQLKVMVAEIANSRTQPTAAASKSATTRASTKTLMTPEVLDDIAPGDKADKSKGIIGIAMLGKHIAFVVAGVISRYRKSRDHGLYLTIVEEILREFYVRNVGKFLWDGMKKEIDQAFDLPADAGGRALINGLCALWTKDVRPRITVVGHSAGAIFTARLINEIEKAKPASDVKLDVVLIAPACTFKVFREMLESAKNRIKGLRIFGMKDERERQDALVPVAYPSSLLYFVSGVIEDAPDMPLLGMQRYYGTPYQGEGFEDLAFVRASEQLKPQRAYAWADTTGFDGGNCDMKMHGGWATAEETLQSVLYIIKNGLFNG